MAGTVVNEFKGMIGPLLDKLTKLVEDKYANLVCVSSDIVFLRDELHTINVILEKLENTDELDPTVKDWRDKVREMGYDIEDLIDEFMHSAASDDEKAGFIDKVIHFLKTLRTNLETAKKIKELRTRLKEINERRKRYKFDCISSSSPVVIDPRLPALYSEAANLVGIEGPKEDVIKLLTDTDQQLKVLSIVGFGGLGKTTLAKEVYNKIGDQFNTKVFVSVSQRPDIVRLLNAIQSKLSIEISSPIFDVKDTIDSIRAHLQHIRYFVVVDDLWDVPTWDIIRSAFPENDLGSKVIVTTRVEDVASWASCSNHFMYIMKPLGDEDSRKLFCNRIFGSEDRCPSQFHDVTAEILKKCGGLPLAIITIASLLANRPAPRLKEWESVRNTIGTTQGSATYPMLERIRQILYLSYKDLPCHLRTCFLYLGIYPEDFVINRDDLSRQWVAEGFVHHLHGRDLEDVSKSYFNELINRSLIQPEGTEFGEVVSCRVHDMMLDLILSRCAEVNFISVAENVEEIMVGQQEYKIRRLLLNLQRDGDATIVSGSTATCLARLRSLHLFRGSLSVLSLSKYMRSLTLYLRNAISYALDGRVDLTAIGQLFQLRYLKVIQYNHSVIELPTKFQGLQHLATLEIDCTNEIILPSDIVHLPRLSHLIFPGGFIRLPNGIGSLKSLHILRNLDTLSLDNVKGLGELTNLRDLEFCSSSTSMATVIDSLIPSLGKLCNLRRLRVDYHEDVYDDENDRVDSLSQPPLCIEKLDLVGWKLPRIPRWISGDLRNLCSLALKVAQVSTGTVGVLGELPSLINLVVNVQHGRGPAQSQDSSAVVQLDTGFPALESFKTIWVGDVIPDLRFEAGAMPSLQVLTLQYRSTGWSGAAPVGLHHLVNLRQIDVSYKVRQDVEDQSRRVFTEALEAHRNRPTLYLHPTGSMGR